MYSKSKNKNKNKNKKGGAEGSSNSLKKYPSTFLKMVVKRSENDECHMINPDLYVSTKNMKHPNLSDLIILGKNNKKNIDGWFMYILCWIRGERSIILLEGMVDDFKSKHIDMISAIKESNKFKEGDIEYIISGEIYINHSKKEIEMDDDSGTFFFSEQFGNLKRKSGNIFFNFSKVINHAQNFYEIETNQKLEIGREYKIKNNGNKNCRLKIQQEISSTNQKHVYKVKLLPKPFKDIEQLKTMTNNKSYEYSLLNQFDDKIWEDNMNLFIVPFVSSIFTGFNIKFKKKIEFNFSLLSNKELMERYKRRFCKGKSIYKYSNFSDCEEKHDSLGDLCYIRRSRRLRSRTSNRTRSGSRSRTRSMSNRSRSRSRSRSNRSRSRTR